VPFILLFFLSLSCSHAPAGTARKGAPLPGPAAAVSSADALRAAAELSQETHNLIRAEGELLWTRWTTGAGPLPSSALAEHPRLARQESIDVVTRAAAAARGTDAEALRLLAQQLATLGLAREARTEIDAVETARAQLAFALPGEQHAALGERDGP